MNTQAPRIILASASPRRRELLSTLGLSFDVLRSDVDESVDAATLAAGPSHVAETLALRKARAVAAGYPDALVIGSDTIVTLDGRLLGKPDDVDTAFAMLRSLRGRAHEVTSGVAVVWGDRDLAAHERTTVHMREYTDAEIETFIASGSPFDKAGGYAIQDEAFAPVAHFEGCRCNVVGLPTGLLAMLLDAFHVRPSPPSVECPVCNPLDVRR
ncbi:MAG: septum formation protein Maf [Chloroflexi bacterium]|nr:septum formation protein Maf [Chloroflexota bacterium]